MTGKAPHDIPADSPKLHYLCRMTNTDYSQQAVEALLTKVAKIAKPANRVGTYVSHTRTGEGEYLVTLSNGKILFYDSEIKSIHALPEFRIPDILARFIPQH